MEWTAERKTEVARLWNEGQSATQIGVAMGASRLAVMGIVHRLRTAGHPMRSIVREKAVDRRIGNQSAAVVRIRNRNKTERKPPRPEPVLALPENMIGVPLIDHPATACKFPVNRAKPGEPHLFCTQDRGDHHAYCPHHRALAYARAS